MDKKEQIKELEKKIISLQHKHSAIDNKSYSYKIFLNSFFGIFSNEFFRYFDLRLASAVTSLGQVCIKGPEKYLSEKIPLLTIDYQDTDSLFINFTKLLDKKFQDQTPSKTEKREFIKWFSEKAISPLLKKYYEKFTDNLNSYKNTYEMDVEVIADKTIFVAKKKYVMNLVHKKGHDFDKNAEELKITGIEIVRTSSPQVVRNKLKELIKLVMDSNDNNKCIDFIENFRKEFNEMSFEQVTFPRGVNGLSKYSLEKSKGIPIHVRASHTYNKALKDLNLKKYPPIFEGDKIKFCYVKEPNIFRENIMACSGILPKEIQKNIQINYPLQFEKTFLAPIDNIFNTLGWSVEKINSLEEFFEVN